MHKPNWIIDAEKGIQMINFKAISKLSISTSAIEYNVQEKVYKDSHSRANLGKGDTVNMSVATLLLD